ncbi:hypothetical protein ACROYT_G017295 [Oculina patagonica]
MVVYVRSINEASRLEKKPLDGLVTQRCEKRYVTTKIAAAHSYTQKQCVKYINFVDKVSSHIYYNQTPPVKVITLNQRLVVSGITNYCKRKFEAFSQKGNLSTKYHKEPIFNFLSWILTHGTSSGVCVLDC